MPDMRFVPVKTEEQQSSLMVHRLHETLKAERAACINRIRGLLAEQWRQLDEHLAWCDQCIAAHLRDNPAVRAAAQPSP